MRNTLISEPVLLLHSDHMYWGHEKPLPALSGRDKVLLEEPSRNIQPCWGDDLSDTPLRSLGKPTPLAPTQGQTQVSNLTCNKLWHVSCPSWDEWLQWAQVSQEQWPESRRDSLGYVHNDQMAMFGQLSSPSGFLLSMSQIFLFSFLAKALLNG